MKKVLWTLLSILAWASLGSSSNTLPINYDQVYREHLQRQFIKCEATCIDEIKSLPVILKSVKSKPKQLGVFNIGHDCKSIDIQEHLIKALLNYNGPQGVIISSGKRNWNTHSDHFHGNAVDISWKRGAGKEFAEWLDTEEGNVWLSEWGLSFYYENIKHYKNHKNYLYNRNASGPHIHIYKITHKKW